MEKRKSYVTFTREVKDYKWFKPLLVFLLTLLFELVASSILSAIFLITKARQGMSVMEVAASFSSGYDALDVYSPEGAILSLGAVAVFIPAIWLASLIVKDRPFKTYGSISGGFDIVLFFKFVLVALVPIGIPVAISIFREADYEGHISFTVAGLIMCIILTPLQCIAEEYFFRGLIMQTIGGWFKIPVLAIILQAIVFASQHPYNIYGVLEVFFAGILLALMAYITDGLEAPGAAHFVNNFTIFMLNGFGFKTIKTDTDLESLIFSVVVDLLFLGAVYYLVKKKNFVKRPELVLEPEMPAAMPVEQPMANNGSNEV